MASVTEAGIIRIYAVTPSGHRFLAFKDYNTGAISAGGSPDAVLANLTEDKHKFIPQFGQVLTGGWKVIVTLEMAAADGLDASDAVIRIPLTVRGGGIRYITSADLGYTVDVPAATAADVEVPIGSGYTIPNGQEVKIGGAKGVISIEDDTA